MDPPSYIAQNIPQPQMGETKGQPMTTAPLTSHPYGHAGYNTVCPTQSVYVPPEGRRAHRSKRRRTCVRILHLLLLDAILFMVFMYTFKDWHGFVGAVKGLFFGHSHHGDIMNGDDHEVHLPHDCVEVVGWSKRDDDGHHHDYSHVVETLIDLPISSDLLYFTSHGSLSHGVVRFTDEGDKDSDTASVNVRFLYDAHDLPDFLKVCRLQNGEGKNGVGIFSPQWMRHPGRRHHRATVEVVVTLPAPVAVNALETTMPLFFHNLADMRDSVIFGSISLQTSNMPIVAKYLSAEHLRLHTSNAHITGILNSTQSIDVSTSNAFIEGEFIVGDGEDEQASGSIKLHTSNAHIKAAISLNSTAADTKGGEFVVTVQTSNAPLDVRFNTAPVNSTLSFKGTTTNSPASASLHETFEGSFSATTGRWFQAAVHVDDKEDPSGEGRKRVVTNHGTSRGHAEGNVSWGETAEKKLGRADLVTSNSPVRLYL